MSRQPQTAAGRATLRWAERQGVGTDPMRDFILDIEDSAYALGFREALDLPTGAGDDFDAEILARLRELGNA